jgi:type VI protein secretion system component Hcp
MANKRPDQSAKVSTDAKLTDQDLDHVAGGTATNQFLKLDGIDGESKDDKHKDTIHVESFRKP